MGLDVANDSSPPALPPPQLLLERLKDYGQEQTLALWPDLCQDERDALVHDLESVDLPRVDRIMKISLTRRGIKRFYFLKLITATVQNILNWVFRVRLYFCPILLKLALLGGSDAPIPHPEPLQATEVAAVEGRSSAQRERWWGLGLRAIADGKLAVLLLSGGQGTRLGSSDPKGCFNIGLPSGKSLFQLQAERILRIQKLASQSRAAGKPVKIPWYIMTSPFTNTATRKFFESRKFFGLEADQVVFFQQGTLPCISKEGKFIMATPWQIARAPDGNGGVYAALKSSKSLEAMTKMGVQYVDCYSVDNALVRVADPLFLGYCLDKGASCAAKVVKKAYPQERVGVFVRRGKGGPVAVLEYSELDSLLQFAINQESGRLLYNWSNVCMHIFSVDFLNNVVEELERDSMYHTAEKTIPSVEGSVGGIKLEKFIFDVFPYAPSVALFEVIREEEFAPVKNAAGVSSDSPDSARSLLLQLHMRWVISAGGNITNIGPLYVSGGYNSCHGAEVSPLLSYAGEGLDEVCKGRTFQAPCEIHA